MPIHSFHFSQWWLQVTSGFKRPRWWGWKWEGFKTVVQGIIALFTLQSCHIGAKKSILVKPLFFLFENSRRDWTEVTQRCISLWLQQEYYLWGIIWERGASMLAHLCTEDLFPFCFTSFTTSQGGTKKQKCLSVLPQGCWATKWSGILTQKCDELIYSGYPLCSEFLFFSTACCFLQQRGHWDAPANSEFISVALNESHKICYITFISRQEVTISIFFQLTCCRTETWAL